MIKRKFSALQVIALGFFLIAMLGTLLLMLPISSSDGTWTPFLTALFTSVSSSCVTGLVLVDTAMHWSLFGQVVIILLIQTGGLGFMTIATFFMSFAKKNINLRNRSIMAESTLSQVEGGKVDVLISDDSLGYDAQQDRIDVDKLELPVAFPILHATVLAVVVPSLHL